jgi:hypothetical protein
MKRAISICVATMVALLVLAGPALAKSPGDETEVTGSVTVSGPGMSKPGSLDGDIGAFAEEAGGFGVTRFPHGPESALGPGYMATIALVCTPAEGDSQAVSIRERLYPFARYGIWANSPAHGGCFGEIVPAGWHLVNSSIIDTLVRIGVPRTAPVPPIGAPGGPFASAPSRVWMIVTVAFAFAALTVLAALVGRQRRSRAGIGG